MDFNNFRAAAYLKNSNKDSSQKSNNNADSYGNSQILRNSDNGNIPKNVKPVNFRKIDLGGNKPGPGNVSRVNDFSNNINRPVHSNKGSVTSDNSKKDAATKAASQRLENVTDYLKSGGLIKVPVDDNSPDGKDSVYRRVAKFLVLIGVDEAARVLPHLTEKQIERILAEIASIRTVSKDEASVILEEFNSYVKKVKQQGGVETAKEMLVKAYGSKRAEELLKKVIPTESVTPFSYLNDLDKERIYLLIKDENVGIQALVLSRIEPKKSASVINFMKPEEKAAVVLRLAKMESVSPEVLRRVDQAMHEKAVNQNIDETENIDGRNALAQILKKMDLHSENEILENLSYDDPDLGQDLRRRLFTIEDVVNADDMFIQSRLREMTEEEIVYLIAGKPDDFREKILSNISANRRAEVFEQNKILTVKRRSDCDKITSQFLGKLRRAFEDGDLIIHNRNDEQFV